MSLDIEGTLQLLGWKAEMEDLCREQQQLISQLTLRKGLLLYQRKQAISNDILTNICDLQKIELAISKIQEELKQRKLFLIESKDQYKKYLSLNSIQIKEERVK
jgi:chromosome segregation and condensation protein ScpB